VALTDRHAQATWTRDCLARFARDCAPGLLKAHKPRQANGMADILAVANAAIVDGDRWAHANSEFAA